MSSDGTEPDRHPWGNTPFNGQEQRVALFQRLAETLDIRAVVETGTFRGSTTLFLHERTGLDVYSCELNEELFSRAQSRLSGYEKIHLYRDDSRTFLRTLALMPEMPRENVFFYLDAHWNADLPLREELEIIYRNFKSPIIVIDDFEVAHRGDFGFDDYGDDAILSLEILEDVLRKDLWLFYPDWPIIAGRAPNRGFIILAEGAIAEQIKTLTPSLRGFRPIDAALAQMRRYRQMYRAAASAATSSRGRHYRWWGRRARSA